MEAASQSAEALKKQIVDIEIQLKRLREQLVKLEAQEISKSLDELSVNQPVHQENVDEKNEAQRKWPLSEEEYKRYGRQMIVPNIGIQGQLRLKSASVLIVGAGGLGCPAAAYLAGAGIGTIGIVDGDTVEVSNLHRQVLHSMAKVGRSKVESAIEYCKSLNPNVKYVGHTSHLTPQNAEDVVKDYEILLDCTDHPTSRYLISDICVLLSKPLISASALRTDGQLIVLNSPPLPPGDTLGGPCYRCVFPKPPPAESVVSCGDGGIIGPVVGVMGVLQALEAIRMIASGKLDVQVSESQKTKTVGASMLLFSSNSSPPFRSVRLRSRRPNCFACSSTASLTLASLSSGSLDYALFCGLTHPVKILAEDERTSALSYANILSQASPKPHILIDVREKIQFDICAISGSINVPFSSLQSAKVLDGGEKPAWIPESLPPDAPIYVVCRLGNDSQVIARKLKDSGLDHGGERYIGDIKGGLRAWKEEVDRSWPEY